MSAKTTTSKPNDRELLLTSIIDAPREKVYRCWTEPALITQWFTPPPWKTVHAETDVRPGGSSSHHHARSRGPGNAQSRRLSRSRTKRAAGCHRCFCQCMAALAKAVHDPCSDLRGRWQEHNKIHRACSALVGGRLPRARKNGFRKRLDTSHETIGRACSADMNPRTGGRACAPSA